MAGWYKQQRNLMERTWFKYPQMVQLYTLLKCLAYVADGPYNGIIIRRGSCPTTRSEMMEMTGLSYSTLDRTLNKLISLGEITVKSYNRFSLVTICDYDTYGMQESLFDTGRGTGRGTGDETDSETDSGTGDETIHLFTIEERNKKEDSLITPYSPYKTKREARLIVKEIQKKYNERFAGRLPESSRMTMTTQMKVEECIRHFGRQSVDIVFDQIDAEPFSFGKNKNRREINFQYIFEPQRFQEYLERGKLRISKKPQQPESATVKSVGTIEDTVATPSVPERQNPDDYRREMREYAAQHPDSVAASIVAQWDANNE